MSIHEDARQGKLVRDTLTGHILKDRNILDQQDPATGYAPLATAAVAGFAEVVQQVLNRGAKADALSRDGETALLLTARETSRNRPRIIQLLLSKTPTGSVDAAAADGSTPLMHAVLKRDIESIRLLVQAGASETAANISGQTVRDVADALSDTAVLRALNPNEQEVLARMTNLAVSSLLYVTAWVNRAAGDVAHLFTGLNPQMNEATNDQVNDGEMPSTKQFIKNLDCYVQKNSTLERFFKGNPKYIQDVAKKAIELGNDPSTPLGQPDLLPKTVKVTLHQQVIYCDDSSSMKRDGRWEAQAQLVKKITQVTTRILPDDDGVALRFINQDVDNSEKLGFQDIERIMQTMSWKRNGNTPIGTYLKSKILEPMVYSKLQSKTLTRPFLISIITDGVPSQEKDEALVEAIRECGVKLKDAGYPSKSVKFMIGQIGTASSAAEFLESVGKDESIRDMVFVTSDQLDERMSAFKEKEADLDRWLVELLFSPITD